MSARSYVPAMWFVLIVLGIVINAWIGWWIGSTKDRPSEGRAEGRTDEVSGLLGQLVLRSDADITACALRPRWDVC